MNFVPPKTLDQQGMLCVHRLREALKEERTACTNRIRGLLAEFGIVLPQTPAILRHVLYEHEASNRYRGSETVSASKTTYSACLRDFHHMIYGVIFFKAPRM